MGTGLLPAAQREPSNPSQAAGLSLTTPRGCSPLLGQPRWSHRPNTREGWGETRSRRSPNQACWSPSTSMARPKSASLTAAPFSLEASSRFSGCRRRGRLQRSRRDPGALLCRVGDPRAAPSALGSCVPLSTLLRGPRTTRTSLPLLPLGVSPQSCCLLCSFPSTLGAPTPSHGPFPCGSYLQVPMDHPHLVAVQDSLQDLLDAVAAEERGESSRRCLERQLCLSCTRRAAFPPLTLLHISTVCHTLVVTQVPVVTQPGAAGHPSRVLGRCVHPWAPQK